MLNCKCVSSDNIRPLTYHIFLLIWVNAWSWPSSDPNFWLFDVETCPITRFDTHSRWGGGFKCLKKKKKKSLVFNATQLATLHRFVWFISLSLLLFWSISFGDVRRCHAAFLYTVSFWKPLKLIGIRTGKTRQTIDTNWPSRWCSVNWNGSAHERDRDTKPPWPAHVVAAG